MAWEKRSLERQEFLRELLNDVRRQEYEEGFALFFRLARIIHAYLEVRDPYNLEAGEAPPRSARPKGYITGHFYAEILPQFQRFARTESEANALLVQFLETLTGSIASRFEGALRRDEQSETEEVRIFGAHRTAEVELEAEPANRS